MFRLKKNFHKITLAFLFLSPAIGAPLYSEIKTEVFAIHSNLLKSWVQYSIRLDDNFTFKDDKSVYAFRKRPSGSVRDLNFMERRYYGIESQKILNKHLIKLKLKAIPSRIIHIEVRKKNLNVFMKINDLKCYLTKIIIHAKKGFLFNYTGHVELIGIDVKSKAVVSERVYQD